MPQLATNAVFSGLPPSPPKLATLSMTSMLETMWPKMPVNWLLMFARMMRNWEATWKGTKTKMISNGKQTNELARRTLAIRNKSCQKIHDNYVWLPEKNKISRLLLKQLCYALKHKSASNSLTIATVRLIAKTAQWPGIKEIVMPRMQRLVFDGCQEKIFN